MAVARLAVILALVACASASASAPAPAPEGGGGGEVPVAPTCSTVYDVAPEQRCRFVRDECAGGGDAVVNYLAIRFCVFEGDSVGSAVGATLVIACFILFYFYLLGDTSSEYFCPALEDVSYLLRWTPTLVGVTLLPLGNGAPDVFAAFASFSQPADDDGGGGGEVGLSSILGAGVFVTSIVVGMVNIIRPNTQLDLGSFRRDTATYGLVVTLTAGIVVSFGGGIRGRAMSMAVGSSMLVTYVVYGAIVIAMEYAQNRRNNSAAIADGAGAASGEDLAMELLPPDDYGEPDDYERLSSLGSVDSFQDMPLAISNPLASLPQWQFIRQTQSDMFTQLPKMMERPDRPLWGYFEEESSLLRKLIRTTVRVAAVLVKALILIFITLPRAITIPRLPAAVATRSEVGNVGDDAFEVPGCCQRFVLSVSRRRMHAAASAFGFPIFSGWAMGLLQPCSDGGCGSGLPSWAITLIVSSALALLSLLLGMPRDGTEPKGALRRAPWVLGAFSGAILWIYFAANELVAALVAMGVIYRIRPDILGLTVLAWGNSIGDALSNVNIARGAGSGGIDAEAGARMAVAGCYAGPLFNLLLGLGGSLIIAAATGNVNIIVDVPQLIVTAGFLTVNVIVSLLMISCNGTRTSRLLGIVLIGLYGVFMAVSAVMLFV